MVRTTQDRWQTRLTFDATIEIQLVQKGDGLTTQADLDFALHISCLLMPDAICINPLL